MMKQMLIASTSTVYGSGFLEYLLPELEIFLKNVTTVTFIPYARPAGITYDMYTEKVQKALEPLQKKVVGLHTFHSPKEAIKNAQAIFVGGGNTFELLNQLYKADIIQTLAEVIHHGTPYLGCSAGSNICGINIGTTNDMPVVYPPSFNALQILSFNLNPHYIELDKNSTHMGETRATRIKEFHVYQDTAVLGLREGSWLSVVNNDIILKGELTAHWFTKQNNPITIHPNATITDYL